MAQKKSMDRPKGILLEKAQDKSTDIAPLIQIAEKWLNTQGEEMRLTHEIDKKQLEVIQEGNRYSFWLLVTIIIAVLLLAGGLIFVKNDMNSGLSILSHMGAIVAGLLAGIGFERARRNVEE